LYLKNESAILWMRLNYLKQSIENQAKFKKRVIELGAKYIDE